MQTSNILRLKDLLTEKSITGKELAEKIGVAEMTISNIVQGKTFPKPETLLNIAKALQVDIKDLFSSTSNSNVPFFVKNNEGLFVEVGSIDIDKLNKNSQKV